MVGEVVMSIEKAREYEANIGWQEYAPNETEKAFKAGSERMLEKAEKWLFENLPYTIDAKTFTTRREILRDFRKAMEKELCNIEK